MLEAWQQRNESDLVIDLGPVTESDFVLIPSLTYICRTPDPSEALNTN